MKPLSFDPAKLNGISERMMRSHHENNYAGAVKNLNRTEQELAAITKETPPLVVTALRERELTYRGSKLLHEQYFGNLGGDGKRGGEIERALAAAYGSADRWEEHFRATGAGLGGYGAAAPKYIDAFFANIRWEVVDQRLLTARKVTALIAG